MAKTAAARETLCALRRQIATIEGRLAERLDAPDEPSADAPRAVLRRHGLVIADRGMLGTGVGRLDAALGGGLPRAALTEIHAPSTPDAGAAAGFLLALVSLLLGQAAAPVLWVATARIFREAGFPYAPGLRRLYGIDPSLLLVAQPPRLPDALWIAEEAARLADFSAVLLEVHGNPACLDLTATRRLHHRAARAGRPVFLLRHAARPEPTAAPVRLVVSTAPAGLRPVLDGTLAGSIGPPGIVVLVDKNRNAPPAQFTLEWNVHDRAFQERRAENSLPVVSLPLQRTDFPAQAGTLLAFRQPPGAAAGVQPSGEQHKAHRRPG